MGDEGLEHPAKSSGNTGFPQRGGAESGAVGARMALSDPDLMAVVNAWRDLPEAVRRQVVAIVTAAAEQTKS